MSVAAEVHRSWLSPWRGLPRAVWILVGARAVNKLGAFTLPFLAVVLTVELGATVAQAGVVMAVFGVATIPSRVFGGHLADRIGRRAAIVLGLTGCAAAQLWIALSSTLWSALVAVVLLGLVFEIYEPPSQATIADVTEPADRPAAYGLLSAAMAAAGVLAGLLAAGLSSVDLRWLFVADAITCLACAIVVRATLPADHLHEQRRQERAAVWRDGRLMLLLASGTVFATLAMALVIGLPLTIVERRLPASTIGILLTVSAVTMILGQPLLRWRRLAEAGDFGAMTFGYLLLAVGLLANGYARGLPAFIGVAIVWSLGELLLLGRYLTIASALAPDHARGRYLAVFGLSWGVATAIAPILVTQLLEAAGPALLWSACSGIAVLTALAQPALRRRISDR